MSGGAPLREGGKNPWKEEERKKCFLRRRRLLGVGFVKNGDVILLFKSTTCTHCTYGQQNISGESLPPTSTFSFLLSLCVCVDTPESVFMRLSPLTHPSLLTLGEK